MPAEPTAAPPVPEHDPGEVGELADDILSREEFQEPSRSLLERIGEWLADLFRDGDGANLPSGVAGSGGSSVLTVLFLVLAVVAIALAVRALLRQPRRRRRKDDDEPVVEVTTRRRVADWETAAARHEAAGEWKEAMRCRFRALVEELTDDGVVPALSGRTSGELRGDVRTSLPHAAEDFVGAAELFDRAWYGDQPTGPDEAGRFAGHAERVLAAAGARGSGRADAAAPADVDADAEVGE